MSEPFDIVVSAGTYHFPFNRLMDWTEQWLNQQPETRVLCQHGTSRPLPGAENFDLLPHGDLLKRYADADVVVLQGGAGGLMDTKELGLIPIVVPRIPIDNEVVDYHQVEFCRCLAELGLVHLAESEQELHRLLDLAKSGELRVRAEQAIETPGPAKIAELLADLPHPRPRKPGRRHRLFQLTRRAQNASR